MSDATNFSADVATLFTLFQSTHHLRDATIKFAKTAITYFNPRSVSDATTYDGRLVFDKQFQSTHRVSDATIKFKKSEKIAEFQSTHRVSDATSNNFIKMIADRHFNPRTA